MFFFYSGDNVFQAVIDLPKGEYVFKFIVDDNWIISKKLVIHLYLNQWYTYEYVDGELHPVSMFLQFLNVFKNQIFSWRKYEKFYTYLLNVLFFGHIIKTITCMSKSHDC